MGRSSQLGSLLGSFLIQVPSCFGDQRRDSNLENYPYLGAARAECRMRSRAWPSSSWFWCRLLRWLEAYVLSARGCGGVSGLTSSHFTARMKKGRRLQPVMCKRVRELLAHDRDRHLPANRLRCRGRRRVGALVLSPCFCSGAASSRRLPSSATQTLRAEARRAAGHPWPRDSKVRQ